jgi:exopolysaccharide production protein ExoZ
MEHAARSGAPAIGASGTPRPGGAVPPRHPLWSVQVLRGVAALMVVIGHSQSAVSNVLAAEGMPFARSTALPWGAGVDLFFVISGFIMVRASARLFGTPGATAEFLRRRLIRIVPLYWLVTSLFLLLLGWASLRGGAAFPRAGAIIASFAFVPADTLGNGRLFPVYDLGWTLNYEMFFYALLVLVIGLPRGRALILLGSIIGACALIGTVIPGPSAAWFWTRPIILDFGLGVGIGALAVGEVRLPSLGRAALAIAALLALLADPAHLFDGAAGVTVANDWPRVLFAGVPVAALLAAAVLGAEPPMPRLALPFVRIGDASYSLYLLHPFALIVMEKMAQKLDGVRAMPGWLIALATILTAIAIALAGFHWIERPMTRALARRLAGPVRVSAPTQLNGRPSC